MGQLTLFAIGIVEVRDMFGASAELADRLRLVAETVVADGIAAARESGAAARGPLLARVGPVLRRPIQPPRVPARPTPGDVEALLTGHAIAPERVRFAWQIAFAWLDELSWGRTDLDLDAKTMAATEFDLARAGLPSRLSIERLMQGSPQVPLPTMPGQAFGYAKHAHVEDTRRGLTAVIGDVDEASLPVAGAVLQFCNRYPGWTAQAQAAHRPGPDLVVSWLR